MITKLNLEKFPTKYVYRWKHYKEKYDKAVY